MEYTKEMVELVINGCSLKELEEHSRTYYKEFSKKYPGLVNSCSELKYLLINGIENRFCPVCSKTCNFNNHQNCYHTYCSIKCRSKSKDTQDKREKTCLVKYGTKNVNQNKEIKAKAIETCRKKYGNDYNNRSKAKETERSHYNGQVYFKSNEYKQFMKDNRENINNKIRETVYKKTGKIWITQTNAFKNKRIETINKNGTAFISKGEKEIKEYIEALGYKPVKYIVSTHENRFEIDCYIPELKIGIEYNGIYYHSKNGRNQKPYNYHYKKQLEAFNSGIDLIQIWEDQWVHKQNLIKSILKARLKKNSTIIYARKCIIKELDNNTYNTFCNENHTQGTRNASIKLGLYYNDKLIQIASFNKPQNKGKATTQNALYDYEFVRGCTLPDINVIGGVSKLFKYFITLYNPNSILSYVDWNLFNGKSYKECGFEFVGYTGPDLFFITANTLNRISRNPYKYKEHMELVSKNQLWECHGAGNLKMIWHK